jgi:hypothetical protein
MIFEENRMWKQAGKTIFIFDKGDFKPILVRRDKKVITC